jgi:hypothetical protein
VSITKLGVARVNSPAVSMTKEREREDSPLLLAFGAGESNFNAEASARTEAILLLDPLQGGRVAVPDKFSAR